MDKPKYQMQNLTDYINLYMHLTGDKPKEIEVSPDYYTWFIQESLSIADSLGLAKNFTDPDNLTFQGVKLVKKVKIATK